MFTPLVQLAPSRAPPAPLQCLFSRTFGAWSCPKFTSVLAHHRAVGYDATHNPHPLHTRTPPPSSTAGGDVVPPPFPLAFHHAKPSKAKRSQAKPSPVPPTSCKTDCTLHVPPHDVHLPPMQACPISTRTRTCTCTCTRASVAERPTAIHRQRIRRTIEGTHQRPQ